MKEGVNYSSQNEEGTYKILKEGSQEDTSTEGGEFGARQSLGRRRYISILLGILTYVFGDMAVGPTETRRMVLVPVSQSC
jgi:hypothetical protein